MQKSQAGGAGGFVSGSAVGGVRSRGGNGRTWAPQDWVFIDHHKDGRTWAKPEVVFIDQNNNGRTWATQETATQGLS